LWQPFDEGVDVVITTGGTGVTGRDVTPEAFDEVCEKNIPGFGELFRQLSFEHIGTSTIQSRATAGVAASTFLFALPCYGDPDGLCATVAHAGLTECKAYEIVCLGPNVIKENDVTEVCNGLDDDCDGTVDDNPSDAGGSRGVTGRGARRHSNHQQPCHAPR
jgi:molybdopterin biosynthesis enzyme MoaB